MSSKLGPTGVPGKSDSDLPDFGLSGDNHGLSEFNEVDFDYDSVNSPGASSTSSEPVYIRQPGFEHHAHEFKVSATNKNDINTLINVISKGSSASILKGKAAKNLSQLHAPTSLKEVTLPPAQARYFPSPPNTPVSLFSPTHYYTNCRQSPIVDPLKPPSLESPLKPLSFTTPDNKSQPTPTPTPATTKGTADGDPEKVRVGNHTPPGYSSSKGVKKKKTNATDQSREGTPENSRPSGKSKIKRGKLLYLFSFTIHIKIVLEVI